MSIHHLIKNAKNGNFEAAVQVFLNYQDGLNGFEKDEELADSSFKQAIKILDSDFYLNELDIINYKKIQEFKIPFHKNLTVLLSENGIGKTSLLESIRKNLMWIAATTRKENTTGGRIDDDEVNNFSKKEGAYIDCEFQIGKIYRFKGRLARPPEGVVSNLKSELTKYRELGKNLRSLNDIQDINLPLFSYYGIDRLQKGSTKNKSLKFGKIDGYDDSLNSKTSFDTFVEWLIQLLKISKNIETNIEKVKLQAQIDSLYAVGANNKDHPLYDVYDDLISVFKLYPDQDIHTQAKKSIENLESLFKEIYSNLINIQLINDDDGKDKVAIQLENERLFLHQFSDGQRVLFGLIGDIARRLILLNDASEKPFEGRGIVLIDEIELHLHPSWQQKVILILRKSFPNIQFIVTTHSPHVITTVAAECVRIIYIDKETNKHKYSIPTFTKGAESNVVLEDVFDVDPRPQDVEEVKLLEEYTTLVNQDQWDSERAIELRQKLDVWGRNKETELDRIDVEISLRKFKRLKK